MYLQSNTGFEWDPEKNRINLGKHGVAFEDAPTVFDEFHLMNEDTRKSYGEKRFLTMGTLGNEKRVVIIAHTDRNGKIRIISMRKANRREQKIFHHYYDQYLNQEN